MSNINTGGPVFPCRIPTGGLHACDEPPPTTQHFGITLRDYFAAKAMPVHMAALSTWDAGSQEAWQNEIARLSYATADAMLKARNNQE